MRGFNLYWPAVLVSAVVIYLIGFLIYGLLFAEAWMGWMGASEETFAGEQWRMALSPIMPILQAIGVGVVLSWAKPADLAGALSTAALVWLLLMLPVRLYAYAYSAETWQLPALDGAHLLLDALAAAAIQHVWRPKFSAASVARMA